MGKAGEALKQVLEAYDIGQSQLASVIGVNRSVVNNWIGGHRTPVSDGIPKIYKALQSINPAAAEEFIRLYLEG